MPDRFRFGVVEVVWRLKGLGGPLGQLFDLIHTWLG